MHRSPRAGDGIHLHSLIQATEKLNLVLHTKTETLLTLSLQRGIRTFFFLFGVFLSSVMGITYDPTDSNIGPLVLIFACFLLGLYKEAWIFNAVTREIEQQHGLQFLFKRRTLSMDQLESVQLSRFIKGQAGLEAQQSVFQRKRLFQPEYHRLMLVTKEGEKIVVEILKIAQGEALLQKANAIAGLCQVPLIQGEEGYS
ncbi:MAG: hypothetical protein HQM13_19440 [SAR324 cluster bacterium]|nr:hypothetical protein [SAR324 cluster bacterium]